MKSNLRYVILFLNCSLTGYLFSQSNMISIDINNEQIIKSIHNGQSFVNIHNTCTDQTCMENVYNLEPGVVRWPSAGDAQFFTPSLSMNGYGRNFNEILDYLVEIYNCDPRINANDTYTCPSNMDPSQTPLQYNNACDPTLIADMKSYYCNSQYEDLVLTNSYMADFSVMLDSVEERSGKQVDVIYVANIGSGYPHDLIEALDDLFSLGVNVVGVELGNEPWGKSNQSKFPDFLSYFAYVSGDTSNYNGILEMNGDYITAIRNNYPNISIMVPVAPSGGDYFGCSIAGNNQTRFNTWNNQISTIINDVRNFNTVNGVESLPIIDGGTAHIYFDDKLWGSDVVGCENCLTNGNNYFLDQSHDFNTATSKWDEASSFSVQYLDNNDPVLTGSFDCFVNKSIQYTDSGFADVILDTLLNSIGITDQNGKKVWITEFNVLENNNEKYTRLFHNSFAQSNLIFNWRMSMLLKKYPNSSLNGVIEYSTFYNCVSENNNGAISKRNESANGGDDPVMDFGSSDVKRMAYFTNKILSGLNSDSLIYISSTMNPTLINKGLRTYTFLQNNGQLLQFYYTNPSPDSILLLTSDFVFIGNNNLLVDLNDNYSRCLAASSNYSTSGYNYMFECNENYYTSGPGGGWSVTLDHDFVYSDGNLGNEGNLVIKPYSQGWVQIPLVSSVGINIFEKSEIKLVPNILNSSGSIMVFGSQIFGNEKYVIYDSKGGVIARGNIENKELQISNPLPQGLYIVTIYGEQKVYTDKLVIK